VRSHTSFVSTTSVVIAL